MQSINEKTVILLLNQANGTNLNNVSRKSATQQLMNIQNASGYPSTLLKIWQSSQPDTLREIALAQFKNHAVNNFKQTQNNQEKEHCKNLLLTTYLNEKSEQVSKQISQCIAKLARREWPTNWSSLFAILVNNIKSDDALCVLRTALIISDILQEVASMRLPIQIKDINKLSQQLMPILFAIWTRAFTFSFSMFASTQNCDLNKLYQCLKLCSFLSKSIKVLIRKSHSMEFSSNSVGGQYLNKSLDAIRELHDRYYKQLISHKNRHKPPLSNIIKCINSIIKTLLITIRDAHYQFTLQFRLILPAFLSYYTHIITKHKKNHTNNKCFLNEVIVYALLFLYDVCKLQQYEGKNVSGIQFDMNKVTFNQADANECKMIVTHFFSTDRLTTIIQCLVTDLFILDRKDLEQRKIDPCVAWQQHHIEHNNDNIRAAAKQLFRALVKKYTSIAAPVIVNMFKSITNINTRNIHNINALNYKVLDPENEQYKHFFLLEAIYLALGLKYFHIFPYLNGLGCNFSAIGSILSSDLKLYGADAGYRIPFLTTRIIWLFGRLKDDINKNTDTKQFVYQIILKHLQPGSAELLNGDCDFENELLLLRLDSAEALYHLLDDNGFECKEYEHLLQDTFNLLLKLVSDCDVHGSLECMQDILRYICCTIKQNAATLCRAENGEIVNSIFVSMGLCWDNCASTETNLCRVNLIECITHLVGCMKSATVHKLYDKLIPIIAYCTGPESIMDDKRICLVDQGLELWHKVLYHSYELCMDGKMNKLFASNWIAQMKTNGDFFDILMAILKSYLFLGGSTFVQHHASDIGQTLTAVVPDITGLDDSFSKITDVLCYFVQLFPQQSPQFLFGIIQHLVVEFLRTVKDINNNSNLRIECYMLFFCRLLLVNTDGMLKVLQSIQVKENNPNLMQQLFQAMFAAKNKVKQFYKQKIVVLGLLKIFRGVTNNDNDKNLLIRLLIQLLPWWLYVIKDTEIDCLEFAEDMHPEISEENKQEWTEADRISNLYCNDMVSHTFMIDVVLKTLKDSTQKLNISMEKLLHQIQSGLQTCTENDNNNFNKNINVIKDCKHCIDKYNQYLQNKDTENE